VRNSEADVDDDAKDSSDIVTELGLCTEIDNYAATNMNISTQRQKEMRHTKTHKRQ